jgi:signal transduction histidine kinase
MTNSNPEPDRPDAVWTLVLTADGTVLVADGGAPTSWIGSRLADRTDVPEDVKAASRELVERAHQSSRPTTFTVPLRSGQTRRRVHLTVVDALAVHRVPTDLRALLHCALDALRRQAQSVDVALHIDVQEAVPRTVLLDANKVAWAVTAIVGNALRYVPHGSPLMPGGTIAVHVRYAEASHEIAIEVQDDGPGIPADKLPQLFEAGSDRGRGGLGLLMVRDVVVAHGGHVEVQSHERGAERGTTVRLTLPVS